MGRKSSSASITSATRAGRGVKKNMLGLASTHDSCMVTEVVDLDSLETSNVSSVEKDVEDKPLYTLDTDHKKADSHPASHLLDGYKVDETAATVAKDKVDADEVKESSIKY